MIIPTLNEAELLPRLLEQLTPDLRQRFNIEVIVSDGGSTDKTIAIAHKYKCQVVPKLEHEQQTIAAARNKAAWRARGDILVFMDADGYWQNPWHFFGQLKHALTDRKLAAVTVRVEIEPAHRTLKDKLWLGYFNNFFYFENKIGIGMGRGNCQIVRATAFRQVHGYNERLVAAEDYDLFRRLRRVGEVRFFWPLVVYESPRRFRKLGYIKVAWLWLVNSVSYLFVGRSRSKRWQRV